MVDVAPQAAAAYANGAGRGIHADVLDRRQVDHQAVVAHAESTGVVPAAANRDPHLVVAGESESGHHIGHIGALRDQARFAIDHRVVNFSSIRVLGVLRVDQRASELTAKFSYRILQ